MNDVLDIGGEDDGQLIQGYKGGESKPRAAVEAPDSLHSIAYAKIVDLISEGEIVGLVNGNKSIFLSEAVLENDDGSLNFDSVVVSQRFGTQDQSYIPGYPSVESEIAVGFLVKTDQPYVRAVNNLQLSAVRVRLSIPRLTTSNISNGDTNGGRVEYRIDVSTGGGAYQPYLTSAFDGKTTSKYEKTHRIDLPPSTQGWSFKVVRITPDSTSDAIVNAFSVESVTEVIDAKFRYPNSALIAIQFDASQFSSIPVRAYHMRGRIISVPSNYDPVSRTYSGIWNGTFKPAYTNNPAWIYYDLILHPRYGLGHLVNASQVDRYELYRISQYCDEMVPDGKGGTEPRFVANLYLQTRADALKVMQDISAIFRGMGFWGSSQIYMSADMPDEPVYTYTNANVVDGKFVNSGAGAKTRFSVCLVSWNDPSDFYRAKVQYTEDRDSLAMFGPRETSLTGLGISSQGQADRLGRWTLLTNKLETETVSFSVGLDGVLVRPGNVIRVANNNRAGRRIGGRIVSATVNSLLLDSQVTVTVGDTIVAMGQNGKSVDRVVSSTSVENGLQRVNFVQALDNIPPSQSMWALEAKDLVPERYRVLAISEDFSNPDEMRLTITATKHIPGKYASIDTGTRIELPPISVIPPGTQSPVTNVTLTSDYAVDQGNAVTTMTINWDAAPNAVAYEVQWKMNNGSWVYGGRVGTTSLAVQGILAGRYIARVQAVSSINVSSVWASSAETFLDSKSSPPAALTFLTTESLIFGIKISWGFPEGLDTQTTQRTELWYSETAVLESALKLSDLAYPQNEYTMVGLRAGQTFFFWARLVDKAGNTGPYFPVAPTTISGSASADANDILDYLVGEITKTQLGQDLLSDINKIDGVGPGSVNERLDQVREEQLAADQILGEAITQVNNNLTQVQSNLQDQIDNIEDISDSAAWKDDLAYTSGQSVIFTDGYLYQATGNVPVNTPPPNTAYWLNVGQAVQTANGLAARVTTVENTVTTQGNTITSHTSLINGLRSDVDGKASASAVQSLTTRVTSAEGSLTSQGQAITAINNALPGKADASALSALSNTVTQQGTTLTTQGNAITSINANISNVGGENLIYNPSFDKANTATPTIAEGWAISGNATSVVNSLVTSSIDPAGKAQRHDATWSDATKYIDLVPNVDKYPAVVPGQTVVMSGWFRGTANLIAQLFFQFVNSAGTVIATDGATSVNVISDWQRVSRVSGAIPTGTVGVRLLFRTRGPTAGSVTGFMEWDRVQCELGNVVTGWRDNGDVSTSDIASQAVATTALSGRVTQTETSLTSVSGQITTLTNNIGSAGGDNLLANSSFELPSPIDATRPQYWRGDMGDGALPVFAWVDSPLPSSVKALKVSKPSLINGGYIGPTFAPEDGPRPKVVPGQSYTLSAYVRVSSPGLRFAMYMVFVNEAGTVITAPQLAEVAVGTTFTRLSMTAIAPVNSTRLQIYPGRIINRSGAALADAWMEIDNVQLQEGSVVTAYSPSVQGVETQVAVASTAIASLQSTVTQQGQAITSQSSDIVSLQNSIGTAQPFVAGYAWEFLNSNRNWTPQQAGATFTPGPLYSTLNGYSTLQATSSFGNVNGSQNPYLRIRFRRKNTTRVTGSMYWANEDGGLAEARRMNFSISGTEDWQDVEIDLSDHTQWNGKTGIYAIRLDLENSSDTSGIIDFAYIAVGRRSASASAQALDALTSRVTSAEGTVTSIATRTTNLESSVNSTTNGLATKASAAALTTLTTRVTQTETTLTNQSSSITDLSNSLGAANDKILSNMDTAPNTLWNFDADLESWVFTNANYQWIAPSYARIAAITANPYMSSPAISINGGVYDKVRVRIKRVGGAGWNGNCYYTTSNHGTSGSYRKQIPNPSLAIGQTATLEWDMAALTAGGTDWTSSTITQIRFDFGGATNDTFDVEWIAVGRVAPSASSRAVAALTSTVTSQGNTITSQATALTSLNSVVGNQGSTLQVHAQAISDTSGYINSSYSVKLMTMSNGTRVAAGFGLGLGNESGVTQSQFIVSADRFAVLNSDLNGQVFSPFAVSGGQVIIADAVIGVASITNAKIANGAITNAKIGDAQITSAKIGVAEVDTLRIRGNSVTVPTSAQSNTTTQGAGVNAWQAIIAVSVTMDQAGYIQANFGCTQFFGNGVKLYSFRMLINGQLMSDFGGTWSWINGFPNVSASIAVGPGTFVIQVDWFGEASVQISNKNLFAMGSKR